MYIQFDLYTLWALNAVQFWMYIFQLGTNRVRSFIKQVCHRVLISRFKVRAIDPVYPHPSRKGFRAEASCIKRFPFVQSTRTYYTPRRWPVSFRAALLIVLLHTFCSCTTLQWALSSRRLRLDHPHYLGKNYKKIAIASVGNF